MEQSSVCLLGSNNLGTETLKNLILPAIGSFTIVDDKIVDGSDVGSNFFLLPSNLGHSRAEAATILLSELNGQVKGNFVNQVEYFCKPRAHLISSRTITIFFNPFQLSLLASSESKICCLSIRFVINLRSH